MNNKNWILYSVVSLLLVACGKSPEQSVPSIPMSQKPVQEAKSAEAVWRESMRAKNHVGLDRLSRSPLQLACSNASDQVADAAERDALRKAAADAVVYPEDGVYLGDWRRGEVIAGDGKGMQWTDDPNAENGGNCYACHQMSPQEVAYGTVGPSLRNYGLRGQSEPMLQYTWSKIWNPNAFTVCSHMPRFGDAGILTTQQIRDVMAYLLDPASPVNQ